ncbi:MAG: zinc ribbon domain-containing protein [Actinomycetota bacterium]|nr:zinc ribbon domain-containing protein [Actinomycetota bacterium]
MPVYEYLCKVCETRFEARRPMADAGSPIACPAGHAETTRLLSTFASVGASSVRSGDVSPSAPQGGCGGACSCGMR